MSIPQVLSLSFLSALSSHPAPEGEKPPTGSSAQAAAVDDGGIPALFTWADFDGDARLDFAAVTADGRLQLLVDDGQGRFEDVTERAGLAGVSRAALALWADYDVDGGLDLFVGSHEGPSHLFHNEGGSFVDMTQGSGLLVEGPIEHAAWIDHDQDGRPDLHVITADENELFRGLEGGFFERTELPRLALPSGTPVIGAVPGASRTAEGSLPGASAAGGDESRGSHASTVVAGALGTTSRVELSPSVGPASPLPLTLNCIDSIDDKASSACLQASSTPTLGRLYPLSTNLYVAVGGNVGIGTTSPTEKLDVAGKARIRDTLTLAAPGDVALELGNGSIYKGGALFIQSSAAFQSTAIGLHAFENKSGYFNTACGYNALRSNTVAASNTAVGYAALRDNSFGSANTATGQDSLTLNTYGSWNTATGCVALYANTGGFENTATGFGALRRNTTGGRNTATGGRTLYWNTTGSRNVAAGTFALWANSTGNDNTASGYYALGANQTGFHNTASGSWALSYNTVGHSNTAIGRKALSSNTTGNYNTASGERALVSNTTGNSNTASGVSALYSNTIGSWNTASGVQALNSNTTGSTNTALGNQTLFANTTGYGNTASGAQALASNTTGYSNTACGDATLYFNVTGARNTAVGSAALLFNSSGSGNIAVGRAAGFYVTQSNNIDIGNPGVSGESSTTRLGTSGTHTRTFISGIRGVTTGVANAIPVVVDSNGQLGTVSSSARFKEEIRDMGALTDRLLELRPVVFRYKPEVQEGERPLEYGLIAEEVAEVFPELVVYDDGGQPFTVKYHLLSAMLLNELEKLRDRHDREVEEHAHELVELRGEVAELRELVSPGAAVASPRPAEPARARSGESP